MADELMSAIDYTPTTDVVRHLVTFARLRLGEPRHMTGEAFDRWVESVRQEVRERIAQDIEADTMHCGPRDRCFACTNAARIARGATR